MMDEDMDNRRSFAYWADRNTTPYQYVLDKYPEFRRTGPLSDPARFEELVKFFGPHRS